MTASAILTSVGGVLIVIGVAIVVYQAAKAWPQSRRRAAEPDPKGPKPSISSSGIVVIGVGVLMVLAASLL